MKFRFTKTLIAVVSLLTVAAVCIVIAWIRQEHEEDRSHFSTVESGVLYRSRQPRLCDLSGLERRNINTIVNLRSPEEDMEAFNAESKACCDMGIRMVSMPITELLPSDSQIETFLRLVRSAGNVTLVHCAQGRGRTGIIVAAYRVIIQNWSAEKAMEEMESLGGKSKPEEYAQQLDLLKRLQRNRAQYLQRTNPTAMHTPATRCCDGVIARARR